MFWSLNDEAFHRYLSHLLVSVIAVDAGVPLEEVLAWWDQDAAAEVGRSLGA